MIFYQYDPEVDSDYIMQLIDTQCIQLDNFNLEESQQIEIEDDEEVFIFSNDDVEVGLLWYTVNEQHKSLAIKCLYLSQEQSSMLQNKVLHFAIKRAKYLNLQQVQFGCGDGLDETQLIRELGCSSMTNEGKSYCCYLSK
ncbi:hypothetical protein [Pseudalkalibacillus berkeleyi]|uniref:N-acetyltransferase domain-containing protein n=1 Tax=Pseudalkalibacillus berkeleyi TaxID=1069813 RepID=A0ABS9GYS6_9BACL|nr:hypothetical protein [Pseudalkalibacillus berkeleyi]MCF6136845.1 hypothetical protein [Pseudalkalibacillus berkeleyi]